MIRRNTREWKQTMKLFQWKWENDWWKLVKKRIKNSNSKQCHLEVEMLYLSGHLSQSEMRNVLKWWCLFSFCWMCWSSRQTDGKITARNQIQQQQKYHHNPATITNIDDSENKGQKLDTHMCMCMWMYIRVGECVCVMSVSINTIFTMEIWLNVCLFA